MVRIEFCCDKCGSEKYFITHGYSSKISGFVYAVECAECLDEIVIANEDEAKVSD